MKRGLNDNLILCLAVFLLQEADLFFNHVAQIGENEGDQDNYADSHNSPYPVTIREIGRYRNNIP